MPRKYLEITAADYDYLCRSANHVIATGLPREDGAEYLHIFHINGPAFSHEQRTIVETTGEFQNAEPTWTPGHIAPEDVLADYLAIIADV